MGRKAKLKKKRKEQPQQPKVVSEEFVEQLQRQGYALNQINRSPDLPDLRPTPKV